MTSQPHPSQLQDENSPNAYEAPPGSPEPAQRPFLLSEDIPELQGFWRTLWDMLTRKPLPPPPPDVHLEPYGDWRTLWDMLTRKPVPPPPPDVHLEPYGSWRTLWEMLTLQPVYPDDKPLWPRRLWLRVRRLLGA
jgi:hypothetical protein